jgi:hypothetical protein
MLLAAPLTIALAAFGLTTLRAQDPGSPRDNSSLMKGATYWHWGTGTFPFLSSEWQAAPWARAVTEAHVTRDRPHSGEGSLELTVDLAGGSPDKSTGAVQVGWFSGGAPCNPDHAVDCPRTPLNLDGVTITAYVFAPPGSRGNGGTPNRVRLGVVSEPRDTNPNCIGTPQEINDTPAPGSWNVVTVTIGFGRDACSGQLDRGFDPTKIDSLYFQIVGGSGSYSGKLWLDDVTFSAAWSRPYDFEVVGNSLDRLRATGANYVGLVNEWFVLTGTSCVLGPWVPNSTHTDAEIVATIREIHTRGMKVMLKPMADARDGTGLAKIAPVDVGCFFQSYRDFLVQEARIAQENGVEIFTIGTELSSLDTSQFRERWASLIADVRAVYMGPLTYGADAPHYGQVAFWDLLDYAGIDAYFPVSDAQDPSLDDIVAGWTNHHGVSTVQQIERWQATIGKPVIFTEAGYRSIDYAGQAPGNFEVDHPYNADLQARLYQGLFTVFGGKPWWMGVFWFKWDPDAGKGLCCDTDYNPQNKPAEDVLRSNYSTAATPAPMALTARPSRCAIMLTWHAPVSGPAPDSYLIEIGTSSGAATVSTNSSATGYTQVPVRNGTYHFRVRARSSRGVSAVSNDATVSVGGCGKDPE